RLAKGAAESAGLARALEHLPVTGDEHVAYGLYVPTAGGIAATPGSGFPSSSSSDAPPPVEIHEICSATPASWTARTESPPPTTVKPSHSASARATAKVPSANAGHSKTPIGPFQKTARAPAARRAKSARG